MESYVDYVCCLCVLFCVLFCVFLCVLFCVLFCVFLLCLCEHAQMLNHFKKVEPPMRFRPNRPVKPSGLAESSSVKPSGDNDVSIPDVVSDDDDDDDKCKVVVNANAKEGTLIASMSTKSKRIVKKKDLKEKVATWVMSFPWIRLVDGRIFCDSCRRFAPASAGAFKDGFVLDSK